MFIILALSLALPQDYVNLVMNEKYDEALDYCAEMIEKNKDPHGWKLEMGDIYYNKLLDFEQAEAIYRDVVENYKHKDGWAYYRLAQVLEMLEDYLNSAKMYEIVATRFRKAPLDSFALSGVERCFKKNYQDYVAVIDGYNITRLELDERTGRGSQAARPDERAILDQMVTERLIYTNAVKHDIAETKWFMESFRPMRRTLLVEEVRVAEITEKSDPTEKQMKKYYKENKDKYLLREQILGKEIIVESDSLARFLIDSLKKDITSFDTLAKQYSTAPNARNGGNLGVLYRGRKPANVDSVIFSMEVNTLSEVVPHDDKYGIYYITTHKPEQYRDYEEVVNQIESMVMAENIAREEQIFAESLKKKAKTKVFEDSIIAVLKDTTDKSADVAVAQVNGRQITWGDVVQRNEMLGPRFAKMDLSTVEKVKEMLSTIFDEEQRLELGWRKKYFLNDGYFTRFKDAVKSLMDQGLYQKIVLDAIVIDSAEVEKYYTEHIEEFKMPESALVHEISLDSKQMADKVHEEAMARPESFDSLAAVYSTTLGSGRGGEAGMVRRGTRGEEYDKVLFDLENGEISNVFSLRENNWTIIKMVEHYPEHYRSLDEARNVIESRMRRQRQTEIATEFLDKIKKEADIQILLPEPEETSDTQTDTKE